MIPVFGLMTSGMMRTDTNVGYTNAVEIASGFMNQVLSEQTSIWNLPITSAAIGAYPASGSPLAVAQGNVAASAQLDEFFSDSAGWTVSPVGSRTLRRNGIDYHVWVWIGMYSAANDLVFGHFEDPLIDWSQAGTDFGDPRWFHEAMAITQAEYQAGYSPYISQAIPAPASRITSHPWQGTTITHAQGDITEPPGGPWQNYAKVLVRVSWGETLRRERGRAKDFWLVSFKADLQR
jgi:hypothetical protein